MPLVSPVVFPLLPIIQTLDGPACACARGTQCSRIGKHAAVLWGDLKEGDEVPRPEPGAGVGIKTGARPYGSGIVVVDLDGTAACEAWEAAGGDYETYTVGTGREEGLQLYFRHPAEDGVGVGSGDGVGAGVGAGVGVGPMVVKNTVGEFAPHIDIRGDRGIVVAAGSPHKNGSTYEVLYDLPVASLPVFLLEWLKARPAPAPAQSYEGDVTDPNELTYRRQAYAEYLRTSAPVRGPANRGRGDALLFTVVQKGAYDMALPTEDVLELIAEHYDPRCSPMWGDELEERVHHKAHSAKTASTRPREVPLLATEDAALTRLIKPFDLEKALTATRDGSAPPGPAQVQVQDGPILLGSSTTPPPAKPPPLVDPTIAAAIADDCGFKIKWGGWAATPPPVIYLVDRLFVQNKVVMLYADPGSIKTWLSIDLAFAVATGAHWLGDKATKKGRVLYADYEDGEYEFHRRVKLLTQGMDDSVADGPDLGYLYAPGRLDKEEFWLHLGQLYAKKPFRFLIVDTLRAANNDVDENDVNAAKMLDLAGKFTEVFKASPIPPTVLFVHHANKQGTIRGTSAFKGAVDSVFKLETEEDTDKRHRAILTCEKSGQKKVPPIYLELTDSGLRTYEPPQDGDEGDGPRERVLTDEEIRAKIMLVLEGQGIVGSKRKLRDLVKASAQRVDTELAELVALGEVAKTKDGFSVDSPSRRTARVVASVRRFDYWASEAELAKDAGVTTEFVYELKRRGVVADRASGGDVLGFIVLKEGG